MFRTTVVFIVIINKNLLLGIYSHLRTEDFVQVDAMGKRGRALKKGMTITAGVRACIFNKPIWKKENRIHTIRITESWD